MRCRRTGSLIKRARVLCAAALASGCTALPRSTTGPASGTAAGVTAVATSSDDYRRIEREVVRELNDVRSNPRRYASKVSALLPYFDGSLLRRPGMTVPVQTTEGPSAVRAAVAAMQSQPALPQVTASRALGLAAQDLVNDQSRTGSVGHTGSRGSTPESRISAHGTWAGSYSENVTYGQFASGRDVVVDLLVDDGVPGRGHRRNIFDAAARVVGVACGPHPRYGSMCVIDQVGSYAVSGER